MNEFERLPPPYLRSNNSSWVGEIRAQGVANFVSIIFMGMGVDARTKWHSVVFISDHCSFSTALADTI